jgi:hypothetical protein
MYWKKAACWSFSPTQFHARWALRMGGMSELDQLESFFT